MTTPVPTRITRLAALVAAFAVSAAAALLLGRLLTGAWAPAAGVTLAGIFALAWTTRLALWWRYRPVEPSLEERAALPSLTVVVPAFNEGPTVRDAIDSVLASNYPAELLRVVVVDDGSEDDTWRHISEAVALHPDRAQAMRLSSNRGKRHALYAGITGCSSAVVATLDSDSRVLPDTLSRLVAPLVRDARVAAVAGKVTARNRTHNLLTRMLAVRYVLGFDFVRAYQSELRTVWCCPGALQAYRREVIAPHLEAWREQRFLGARCTNGDDHALTNLVLSLGHDTTYQSTAVVETLVPTTYARLCRMYVRWGRSATREGLRALRFAGQRASELGGHRAPLVLVDAVLQPLTIAAKVVGLFAAVAALWLQPAALLHAAAATTAFALAYCLIYLRSERSLHTFFGLLYAWFAMLALPWVQPFATLTVRRNGWMTRQRYGSIRGAEGGGHGASDDPGGRSQAVRRRRRGRPGAVRPGPGRGAGRVRLRGRRPPQRAR